MEKTKYRAAITIPATKSAVSRAASACTACSRYAHSPTHGRICGPIGSGHRIPQGAPSVDPTRKIFLECSKRTFRCFVPRHPQTLSLHGDTSPIFYLAMSLSRNDGYRRRKSRSTISIAACVWISVSSAAGTNTYPHDLHCCEHDIARKSRDN